MRLGACALAVLCGCSFDPAGVPLDGGGVVDGSGEDSSGSEIDLGTGKDGALVVDTIVEINATAPIADDVALGDTRVPIPEDATGRFAAGDLVMLHHSAGVDGLVSGDPTAVDAASLGVGVYQLVRVAAVGQAALVLEEPTRAAFPSQLSQVVRVPELTSLAVEAGAAIRAPPWNGRRGGIVAVLVDGPVRLDGAIAVGATGFVGGVAASVATAQGCTQLDGATAQGGGAAKGEGVVVGGPTHGRGNLGHAGGGGNCSNAGGGGGGNGGGGGTGGGTYLANEPVGGMGGAAVVADPATHLLFGGGGGAGEDNNDGTAGASGGTGGGIILIRAASITGAGAIRALGGDGQTSAKDGGGGGGAGGTIVVVTRDSLAIDEIAARGGRGGDSAESGAGGGGGGGRVHVRARPLATPLHVEGGGGGTTVNGGGGGAAGVAAID